MAHAPSQARALRRTLQDPDANLEAIHVAARELGDPAHAAPVLAAIAAHPGCDPDRSRHAVADALQAAGLVARPGQQAEVWSEVLRALPRPAPAPAVEAALAHVEAMPDGRWSHDAVVALAPLVGPPERMRLLDRAARNRGFEADGIKAVLAAANLGQEPALRERAEAIPDPDVRRRVLGHLGHHGDASMTAAIQAAWDVPERTARLEALRAVAWNCTDRADLDAVAASAQGRDVEEAARLLCACAARADRFGDPDRTAQWVEAAAQSAAQVPDAKRRSRLEDKVQETAQRAGLGPPAPTETDRGDAQESHVTPQSPRGRSPGPPVTSPAPPGRSPGPPASHPAPPGTSPAPPRSGPDLAPPSGHIFAVVDAYAGGLGPNHLRTAARAAALCVAFGHDLWLIGFPAEDLDAFVQAAQAETRIGEDAAPLATLHGAGRLRLLARLPDDAPGHRVATTPRPAAGKAIDLETLRGPVLLLVGVGAQGLPREVLERAEGHYELTGRRISLETASAMGILADRLARVVPTPTGS